MYSLADSKQDLLLPWNTDSAGLPDLLGSGTQLFPLPQPVAGLSISKH